MGLQVKEAASSLSGALQSIAEMKLKAEEIDVIKASLRGMSSTEGFDAMRQEIEKLREENVVLRSKVDVGRMGDAWGSQCAAAGGGSRRAKGGSRGSFCRARREARGVFK